MKKTILITAFVFLSIMVNAQTTRNITSIGDGLYRFQNNNHYSVFLVTSDGIMVTDPINKEAATWLNTELSNRFDVPVTHLIYSHDHADHISGGEAFGDVTVVAHRLTKEAIEREQRDVPVPDVVFDDTYTLKLGDQQVELYYPGKSHGDNCIAMLFPAQKAVFVVDFITVNRLPYRNLGDGHMPDWIEAIQFVEGLDFDVLIPGHGVVGTKSDATNHRLYFEALRGEVLKGISQEKSLDEMKNSIDLEAFKHFGNYNEWLPLNVEGMYKMLSEN